MGKGIDVLHTEFSRAIWKQFRRAIDEFCLLKSGDSVCACISGGKDSLLLGALFRDYEKHGEIPITVKYLVMDPGYAESDLERVKNSASALGLPIEVFRTEIFRHTEKSDDPCFLCAKMRRGHLYNKARELCCNKIALGHHFDDVIESILMGMIYGGQAQTMLPRVKSKNYAGMELIRPLYYVRERDIIKWRDNVHLDALNCACRVTRRDDGSKRKRIKALIKDLAEENPQIEQNIFRSVCNVRLDRLMSYKDLNGGVHSVLDEQQRDMR